MKRILLFLILVFSFIFTLANPAGALAVDLQSATSLGNDFFINRDSTTLDYLNLQPTTVFGEHKVAVILFNFPDNLTTLDGQGNPITSGKVWNNFFSSSPPSVNTYYQDNSYGNVSFSGDVFDWRTIPDNSTSCDDIKWADLADQSVRDEGVNLYDYDHIFYIFPRVTCPEPFYQGIGWADMRGSRAWSNGYIHTALLAHELGHNLGIGHAIGLDCGSVSIADNCSSPPFDDIFDVMGTVFLINPDPHVIPHFSLPHKMAAGWLDPTSDVTNISGTGIYRIAPLEQKTGASLGLKIRREDNKYYYVEYRRQIGYDTNLFIEYLQAGVNIRLWNDIPSLETQMLRFPELNPGSNPPYSLSDSSSFFDNSTGIKITQLSHDDSGATLLVEFGPTYCTRNKPSLEVTPTSSGPVNPGTKVDYQLTVVNNDSAECPPSQFNLLSELVDANWNQTFVPDTTVTLNPLQSETRTLSVTSPNGQADGEYLVKTILDGQDIIHINDLNLTYSVQNQSQTPLVFNSVSSVSPRDPTVGQAATITTNITASQDTTNLVYLQVYDAGFNLIFDQAWDNQVFQADQQNNYSSSWTPGATGTYRVMVYVFTPGWGENLYSNDNAASGTVLAQAPEPATFTSSTSVSPAEPIINQAVTITTNITASQNTTNIVYLQVYDENNNRTFDQFWDNQTFVAGQPQTFTSNWTPTVAGTHRIILMVFTPGWETNVHYNGDAGNLTVLESKAPEPVTFYYSEPMNARVLKGTPITITVNLTASGETTNLVYVQIFDQNNNLVSDYVWDNEVFMPNQEKSFSYSWTPPTTTWGIYIMKLSVFSPGGGTLVYSRDYAGRIDVYPVEPINFISSATIDPANPIIGLPATITLHITAPQETTNSTLLAVRDSNGHEVASYGTGAQVFMPDQPRSFNFSWTPQGEGVKRVYAGESYRITIQIVSKDGWTVYSNHDAGSFTISQ